MCPTAVRHFDDVIKYCRRTPQRTFFLVSFEIVSLWRLKPCTCVCCKRFQIWSQTRLLLSPILAGPGKPHLPHFLLGTVQCCWRGCRLWHMIWLELGLLFPRTVIMNGCGTLWWRHNLLAWVPSINAKCAKNCLPGFFPDCVAVKTESMHLSSLLQTILYLNFRQGVSATT